MITYLPRKSRGRAPRRQRISNVDAPPPPPRVKYYRAPRSMLALPRVPICLFLPPPFLFIPPDSSSPPALADCWVVCLSLSLALFLSAQSSCGCVGITVHAGIKFPRSLWCALKVSWLMRVLWMYRLLPLRFISLGRERSLDENYSTSNIYFNMR